MLIVGKNPRKVLVNKTISVTAATGSKDQSVSQDGSVALRIIKQPEAQHRARYLTEGSRGSVKDRSGSGYPTVVIEGYNKPAVLEIFIGSETGKPLPHLFYQVCRVAGKSPSSSKQVRRDGTNYLQLQSEQRRGNMFVCDCIGILKERFSDVEGRFPNDSQWKEAKRKSTSCRIVFQTTVQTLLGNLETLQIASEEINCTQLPGTPEILKMNIKKASMVGGEELWIIGKNFLKDTKVNFLYVKPGKVEPTWSKIVSPMKEFFHTNHLIVTIPPFYTMMYHDVQVHVMVKSSGKNSDCVPFTYTAAHPATFKARGSLSAPETAKISVIRSLKSSITNKPVSSKPTILEPVDQHEKNRRARVDVVTRRTQSSPRINFVNKRSRNNQSLSPWRQQDKFLFARRFSSGESSSEDSNTNTSFLVQTTKIPGGDFSSNLTMDFTEFFKAKRNEVLKRNKVSEVCLETSEGVVDPADDACDNMMSSAQQQEQEQVCYQSHQSKVSIKETNKENATIAISLPTSIVQDQVQMKNIIETINTAFTNTDSESSSSQVRKRAYSDEDVGVVGGDGDQQHDDIRAQHWDQQDKTTEEDEKWNEHINEILDTVMEPITFISPLQD